MKRIYLKTLTPEEIIKRLKDGEVVHIDGTDNNSYKMIDGILCGCYDNKAYLLGVGFNIEDYDHYFEEPEEFNVEKTGLYKTRDGSKAFVSFLFKDGCSGVIEHEDIKSKWHIDGSYIDPKQPDNDLVEYVGD